MTGQSQVSHFVNNNHNFNNNNNQNLRGDYNNSVNRQNNPNFRQIPRPGQFGNFGNFDKRGNSTQLTRLNNLGFQADPCFPRCNQGHFSSFGNVNPSQYGARGNGYQDQYPWQNSVYLNYSQTNNYNYYVSGPLRNNPWPLLGESKRQGPESSFDVNSPIMDLWSQLGQRDESKGLVSRVTDSNSSPLSCSNSISKESNSQETQISEDSKASRPSEPNFTKNASNLTNTPSLGSNQPQIKQPSSIVKRLPQFNLQIRKPEYQQSNPQNIPNPLSAYQTGPNQNTHRAQAQKLPQTKNLIQTTKAPLSNQPSQPSSQDKDSLNKQYRPQFNKRVEVQTSSARHPLKPEVKDSRSGEFDLRKIKNFRPVAGMKRVGRYLENQGQFSDDEGEVSQKRNRDQGNKINKRNFMDSFKKQSKYN